MPSRKMPLLHAGTSGRLSALLPLYHLHLTTKLTIMFSKTLLVIMSKIVDLRSPTGLKSILQVLQESLGIMLVSIHDPMSCIAFKIIVLK